MKEDQIVEIGIDEAGSMYVRPATEVFPYIYREAMEVGWDVATRRLFCPKPREWSYPQWFRQIVGAAKEQGVILRTSAATSWINVPDELRTQIEAMG